MVMDDPINNYTVQLDTVEQFVRALPPELRNNQFFGAHLHRPVEYNADDAPLNTPDPLRNI
jgi:hypothetical protein